MAVPKPLNKRSIQKKEANVFTSVSSLPVVEGARVAAVLM
jgi:hypothetical protein